MDISALAMDRGMDAMMVWHMLLMNVAAPLAAYLLRDRAPSSLGETVFAAAAVQLALLWGWHSPIAMDAAIRDAAVAVVMQASLFLVALWFWSAVVKTGQDRRWRALLALLLTGKLFCLLGALFVFSGSSLYASHGHVASAEAALASQQFAGLLMLAVCPVTYVAAAIFLAVRWFGRPAAQA